MRARRGRVAGRIERPEPDRLARAVARAKLVGKLFAKKEEVKLGRYHLLEMIGAGGMGVVWGAFDPELDRRVAIKLVKTELSVARERMLAEGKALAKLSHPNVVTVYDVGVVDDQIYIVMEWVRGQNLRAYCRTPRTVREILALYRAAGEGLSAAHRAGLIHRDFKPDNAMIGDDGRVRVLDFGLARGEVRPAGRRGGGGEGGGGGDGEDSGAQSAELTRGAGTPRYMPPEQAEGKELTPAVDQYAFCVSLREALSGAGSAPVAVAAPVGAGAGGAGAGAGAGAGVDAVAETAPAGPAALADPALAGPAAPADAPCAVARPGDRVAAPPRHRRRGRGRRRGVRRRHAARGRRRPSARALRRRPRRDRRRLERRRP